MVECAQIIPVIVWRASVRPSSSRTDKDDYVWTFLSNYAHVLVCIARDPDVTLRGVAEQVGVTERAVHRIVGELEAGGVVTKIREGRRNHYEIVTTVSLRHPLESERTVGDLLAALLTQPQAAALGLGPRTKKRHNT